MCALTKKTHNVTPNGQQSNTVCGMLQAVTPSTPFPSSPIVWKTHLAATPRSAGG